MILFFQIIYIYIYILTVYNFLVDPFVSWKNRSNSTNGKIKFGLIFMILGKECKPWLPCVT